MILEFHTKTYFLLSSFAATCIKALLVQQGFLFGQLLPSPFFESYLLYRTSWILYFLCYEQ